MKSRLILALALLTLAAARAHAQPPATPAAVSPAAAYLTQNAKAPGVKVLASGLQYKILQSGPPGASPKPGDIIKVHYEGSLTSGTVFDSSLARGKPMIMPLANLVPGWMEAIPLMRVGDEWMLYLPPELGYGADAAGPIPANSVLIFRITLLGMLSAY